jgi:hypothetical protein
MGNMKTTQAYTEEQINGLLDMVLEIKAKNDAMRIEVEILRTLLTKASLPELSTLDPRPSTSLQS